MNQITEKPLRGHVWMYYETGYEGSIWAFQDEQLAGYPGLHILQNGDKLKMFSKKNPAKVLWEGTLDLSIPQKNFLGWVVATHLPVGIRRSRWKTWFQKEYCGELLPKK